MTASHLVETGVFPSFPLPYFNQIAGQKVGHFLLRLLHNTYLWSFIFVFQMIVWVTYWKLSRLNQSSMNGEF